MIQSLSIETKVANFCYCPKTPKDPGGWVVDATTGRGVHWSCGKPAPMAGIRICMNEDCKEEFIDFSQSLWIVNSDKSVSERLFECAWCKANSSVELR